MKQANPCTPLMPKPLQAENNCENPSRGNKIQNPGQQRENFDCRRSDDLQCRQGYVPGGNFRRDRIRNFRKNGELFLESACFSPTYIRKSGTHHQLKTDASFRFERGTDPNITIYALQRAALLIQEIAGGQISSDIVDIYPKKIEHRTIVIKDKNVARLIGKEISRDRMFSILESLDIRITEKKDDFFTLSVPPYRVDVRQEADVVEEILRIYGFNNIALSEVAGTSYLSAFPEKDINKLKREIGEIMVSNGFYEILTNLANECGL